MEELWMMGIVGDVRDAAKGITEEREVVQTMREMGKQVSLDGNGGRSSGHHPTPNHTW